MSERETPEVRALIQLARRLERQRDELAEALDALLLDIESRPRHWAESAAVKRARALIGDRT